MFIKGKLVNVVEVQQPYKDSSKGTYACVLVNLSDSVGVITGHRLAVAFLQKAPDLLAKIKTLQAGQDVSIVKIKRGQYTNIVDIIPQGTEEAWTVAHPDQVDEVGPTQSSFGGGGANNARAAIGQALNLAVQLAISEGKGHDDAIILSYFTRFKLLVDQVQSGPTPAATSVLGAVTTAVAATPVVGGVLPAVATTTGPVTSLDQVDF